MNAAIGSGSRALALFLFFGLAATALACASNPAKQMAPMEAADAADASGAGDAGDRKVRKTADLELSVDLPEETGAAVERIFEGAGGYVERSVSRKDESVRIRGRVPAEELDRVLEDLSELGEVEHRSVTATDVTEEHADLATRLENSEALLRRLRQLVKRAQDVDDVLAIEKQLARVQTEVESLQGRLDRLESQIAFSKVSVELSPKRVYGPLAYVGYGVWWALSKLFVIR